MEKNWKYQMNYMLGLLGILILMTACDPSKKIETGNLKSKSARFLTRKMENNLTDYEYFNAKVKIRYIDMTQNRSVRMNMRLQKDKAIWASVTFLSIEAARLLITPDSVKVLNRLGKEYIVTNLKYIEKNTGISVSFNELQDLIIGNPVRFTGQKYVSSISENQHVLTNEGELLIQYFLNAINYQLEQQQLVDNQNKRELNIYQKDYREADNKANFPYIRNVFVKSKETGNAEIQMNFTRIEFDVKKPMPFDVPSKYKQNVY